jgi:hypothetical protein
MSLHRCWKSRCGELPPYLAVNRQWNGSSLLSCADHVGQLARLGFDVHLVDDVLRDPVRHLGRHADALELASQRHRNEA